MLSTSPFTGPGGVPGDGPGPDSWGWQSCTENLHQFSGRTFRDYTFDLDVDAVTPCNKFWNSTNTLNTNALTDLYGGYKLGDGKTNASNIIWSNGLLGAYKLIRIVDSKLSCPPSNLLTPSHTFFVVRDGTVSIHGLLLAVSLPGDAPFASGTHPPHLTYFLYWV